MKAVMLDVPEALLAERARLGLDGRDEMWNGVLHVVPPANGDHQRLAAWLLRRLGPAADANGLFIAGEAGLWAADDDYKVPDLLAASGSRWTRRGVEVPCELVIEIRSPVDDETMEKIPWYLDRGIAEVVVIDRDTLAVEHHTLDGSPRVADFALRSLPGVTLRGTGDNHLDVRSGAAVDTYGAPTSE